MLRFPVPLCTKEDWKEKLRRCVPDPGALAECRELNVRFARKVFAALDQETRLRQSGR